jgi:hypothetical protein
MQKFMNVCRNSLCFGALLLTAVLGGCGVGGGGEINSGGSAEPGPPPTAAGAGTGVAGLGRGPAPLDLKTSANYVILSVNALTNQPSSQVTGNVGLTKARGSLIQLSCGEVVGQIVSSDNSGPPCRVTDPAGLNQGEVDADDAYLDAIARTPDYNELGGGNIGGLNLGPATYHWTTGVSIPTNLTLTGGPNDVWIFQIMEHLEVAPDVHIILKGGALPQNVFWAPTWAVDLGASSRFSGILLPAAPVFMRTGASIQGKLLAFEVHLDQNIVGP